MLRRLSELGLRCRDLAFNSRRTRPNLTYVDRSMFAAFNSLPQIIDGTTLYSTLSYTSQCNPMRQDPLTLYGDEVCFLSLPC